MVSSGVSPPENLSSHMPSPEPFQTTRFPPPAPVFVDSGGRNYTKISLSNGEEKHVDTYMVMNTSRNKSWKKNTLQKYPKNKDLNF